MNNNIIETLKRINIEDYIWIIYLFLVGYNLYSNYLEKKFLISKDKYLYNKFHSINTTVSFIALIIFIYFLIIAYEDLNKLNINSKEDEKKFKTLTFIASLLFVIGSAISLYVTYKSTDLDDQLPVI